MLSGYQGVYKQIISGDESGIHKAKPKRLHQSCSKIKVMLTVFFDYLGVVHYDFLPIGQTVNKKYDLSENASLA